jgi:isocitrate dehydrogenase (NAD+)
MKRRHTITLIPGDGIGPEVCEAVRRILEVSGVLISWDVMPAGMGAFKEFGLALPRATIDSVRRNKVALKGPTDTPIGGGYDSINVKLRQELGLYANVRPVRHLPGVNAYYPNLSLTILRENLEEFYTGDGGWVDDAHSAAYATGVISKAGAERIFRYGFNYAREKGISRVTAGHKANIIKEMYGLFLDTGYAVAQEFPDIKFDDLIADNLAHQLTRNPYQFGLIILPNLFGDLLSDGAAGQVGGLGLAPGANIGQDIAIFEAVHGTAQDIAGQNLANPTALLLSAVMMLEHIGEVETACRIEAATLAVIAEGTFVTADISRGIPVGTSQFADEIIYSLGRNAKAAKRGH